MVQRRAEYEWDSGSTIIYLQQMPLARTFKEEALEMHKELQHKKKVREKKQKQDFDNYKVGVVARALKMII